MSTTSRRKYYLLGRDRLIAGLAAAAGRQRARDRLRHGAQPHRGRRAPIRRRRSSASTSRRRCSRRRAPASPARGSAAAHSPGPWRRHALRSGAAVRRAGLRPRLHLLRAVDDPGLADGAAPSRSSGCSPAARCIIVDFGDQDGCRAGSAAACATGSRMFHVTPRDALEGALSRLPGGHRGPALRTAASRLRPVRGLPPLGLIRHPPPKTWRPCPRGIAVGHWQPPAARCYPGSNDCLSWEYPR